MSLDSLLSHWHADPETGPNLAASRILPPRPAQLRPFPADLPRALAETLTASGITSLYSHQAQAWELARKGNNIVLATGTASGKTLGYNLPVLAALLENAEVRALYLFPTKALAQDQLSNLHSYQSAIGNLQSAIYDGDTSQSHRPQIRKNARIILTNPDMLHTGILPHHTNWAEFFRDLKFVVIDEMHTYRGVFGSHVANVIRRLKRVARFYGAAPQFVLTSATIGNPQELAERLIEEPVLLIDEDGSSRGPRHFLIYNPPLTDPSLGIRKPALMEGIRLAQDLLTAGVQSLVFARSRRAVEMVLKYLQEAPSPPSPLPKLGEGGRGEGIRGYRSGYLPSQRREIEKGLRDGSVRLVVATNALELGIDIGGLGAALLLGYPGTIASTWQQAGRAGRGDGPAAAVLVASASPLDQFLAHHPDYFFGRSPEQALINPDHLLILLNHLRCAMFELPFQKGELFGRLPGERVEEFLQFLVTSGESHFSNDKYYWMADAYPAVDSSLRSASPENVVLQTTNDERPVTVGEVDITSAFWMVHPRAIYLHEGQQYYVQELNLESHTAALVPVALDYYTEPQRQTEVRLIADLTPAPSPLRRGGHCSKGYGELQVTTQVTGFRKRQWFTGENPSTGSPVPALSRPGQDGAAHRPAFGAGLAQAGQALGDEPLDLPPTEFQTTGYWLSLSEEMIETLRAAGAWTNDPNQYGTEWPRLRDAVRARDGYRCQVCGVAENAGRQHDVHHKVPLRAFTQSVTASVVPSAIERANRMDNLITLCPTCHHKAEANVRMRSGLAGLGYVLGQLAPLFLMCDSRDLGIFTDPAWVYAENQPSVVLYDQVPAGIGFSQKLFEIHDELLARALELVTACECEDGCPSCVGPAGENGIGGKAETLAILRELTLCEQSR